MGVQMADENNDQCGRASLLKLIQVKPWGANPNRSTTYQLGGLALALTGEPVSGFSNYFHFQIMKYQTKCKTFFGFFTSAHIRRSYIYLITNPPQSHPSAGEGSSPPLGGDAEYGE
jgi:hypothetical protein